MIGLIKSYLQDILGIPAGDIKIVVVGGGVSVRSKLVCLCWTGGSPDPRFVVKFPRYPKYNHRVQIEYQALRHLQAYLPEGLEYIPRPVGTISIDGLQVTVERSLPGRMLRAYLKEQTAIYADQLQILKPFSLWLAGLHSQSSRAISRREIEELIFEPIQAAPDELVLSEVEKASLGLLADLANELVREKAPLPVVFNHNDCGATNILVDRYGRFTGLIDWESGGYGLPCSDLIYFLERFAYETQDMGRDVQLKGYIGMFFHSDHRPPAPDLAAIWLAGYCRRVGIALDWIPVLFMLTWIMHARNERNHVLGLRSEGQVLMGKPGGITRARDEREEAQQGHFRSLLRFYLENRGAFAAGPVLEPVLDLPPR